MNVVFGGDEFQGKNEWWGMRNEREGRVIGDRQHQMSRIKIPPVSNSDSVSRPCGSGD